ncbi:aldehyde dehydrogenase family protein [Roseobacter sinensis]|uniref:Aldehyde dehydrogenase family protein n=1 Tax=Roseobacter sinensis TaxID=2931391 RepID=A0ABT3BJP8_9RHOB|nr:aldehyde dehydrogenase family protein [Roseobacter sp. WL0113]MCV3273428.1 aldehyde dehydrogenase family protein [Roseobacter sp. WL0113]
MTGGQSVPNVNPSDTSDVIDQYRSGGRPEIEAAIEAADAAFHHWARSGPQIRHDVLKFVSDELLERREEIGTLLSREEGKILSDGIAETVRAAQIFGFFAGEALRLTGDIIPSVRDGVSVEITREPIGPVGIIAPWNFPIAIPAWKIAPALCYGNTVVFKPAELVPGCAWALAEILSRSGLPKGVFNLVMGKGSVVGQAMLDAPELKGISFTGSQATGQRVAEASVRRQRKFQLEMGGKNPLVVLDDADLERATDVALDGAFYATGQRCTASSRLIVTEGIHNRFVERLTEKVRSLKVGPALAPTTQMGPVVDETQLETDLTYIEIGRSEGANLRAGGERVRAETEGYFLSPALFTDTEPGMRINREEIFGPVASVLRARDYDHALDLANDTEFGLSAGICTSSLKHATDFRRAAQAGMVMVNLPTAGVDYHVPFGGTKASSYGQREQGVYAREFFTTVKTGYIHPG